jgi:hypothetical protein
LALLLLAGCGAGPGPVHRPTTPVAPAPVPSPTSPHAAAAPPVPHLRSGALRGRTGSLRSGARLVVVAAAARVNLRVTDLPGLLYRVSTAADSGVAPSVTAAGGTVTVGLRPAGGDGTDAVDIQLNRAVRWHIRLAAGAGEQRLHLTGGRIGMVEAGAGAGLVRMWLPRPTGTVPITLTGSVGRAEFTVPRGVPVRVRAGGTLAAVSVRGAERHGVPAGTVLTPRRWAAARHRYRLDAAMYVGALTVRE